MSQSTMKFASCGDDPGNSVNAYLWVGVQGVVAPEFIIRPNFLTSNSRYIRVVGKSYSSD
ncbi:hypothetical protein [Leptospira noguchii]|uniref:hypothetical protein n=1 Tax=Leptospira noguchii TaxID=28182 RepID=UPI001F05C4C1|nr:hypothetical protein [Leptospira noguchii]